MDREKEFKKIEQWMLKDIVVRKALVMADHSWFFSYYFTRYITAQTAPFQHEMLAFTEDPKTKLAVITAFRDSGKSTICTLSAVLWSILGHQQKKFVIVIGKTLDKAQIYLGHIKHELENNDRLKHDLGPFQEISGQWGLQALVIPRFEAKIMVGSTDQSIRGLRHLQYRPDLIILDDVEDLESVRTKENRDKLWSWFTGEVLPARSHKAKVIVVGNHLHEDSLLKKLQRKIEAKEIDGVYREYPIVDEQGVPLWPGRFPDQESVEAKRRETMDERAWSREFMLKILPDADQVVHKEWIQFYEELPPMTFTHRFRYTATGIDLAISKNDNADYTAMVSGVVYGYGKDMAVYILPNSVNERLNFPQTAERIKLLSRNLGRGQLTELFIEEVGYQKSLVDHLRHEGFPAKGVQIHGQDKASRIRLTTYMMQTGHILFPKQGAEELINQLIGFPVEKHDDLADAFAILVIKAMEQNRGGGFVVFDRPDRI